MRRKPALEFGTLVHKAMELRYPPGTARGPEPWDTFAGLWEEATAVDGTFYQYDEDGERFDGLTLGQTMLRGYIDHYGDEKHLQSLIPEMAFAIDIVDEHGNYVVTLVGSIDCVFYNKKTKKFLIRDYKTAKSIEATLPLTSSYGEQGKVYWWAATMWLRHLGILKKDQQIHNLEFDWLRKSLPDERPVNAAGYRLNKPGKEALLDACQAHDVYVPKRPTIDVLREALEAVGVDPDLYGEVSKTQPAPLFHRSPFTMDADRLISVGRAVTREANEMKMVKDGLLDVYLNPTKDCKWDCSYFDLCEMKETGGAWQDMISLEYTTWDPYESQAEIMAEG